MYILESDSPTALSEIAKDAGNIKKDKDPEYLEKMKSVIFRTNEIARSDTKRKYVSRSIDREASFFGVKINGNSVQ